LTSGAADTTAVAASGAPRDGAPPVPPADPAAVATAVVLATAPAAAGGPAALLPWEGSTLLGRLLDQLAALGVADVRLVTRPAWEADVREALDAGGASTLQTCAGADADLRLVVEVAAEAGGGLVVLPADLVTHGEALAGLLKDPRIRTGILIGGGRLARQFAFRIRSKRGRVLSAASPYHAVHRPTGSFLGVLKVAAADRAALAEAAAQLAPPAGSPPEEWREELERKEAMWRTTLWRAASGEAVAAEQDGDAEDEPAEDADEDDAVEEALAPEHVELSPEDEARLRERVAAAPEDVPALLLVGLVRGGTHVGVSHLRKLYWARPLSSAAAGSAAERIVGYDEDRVLLDSAVKSSDGFFTTFLVSPYSRYIARWAARRGFTPNQVTTVSLLIGLASAAAFATGERWGLIAGAVLLQAAFTTDCVDGQLARYTRTFSKLGAWLDSIFDRSKEYLAFAGLAIGASRAGDPVWLLACGAITLQTVRHMTDFSFGAGQTQVIGSTPQPPVRRARDAGGLAAAERRARAAAAAANAAATGGAAAAPPGAAAAATAAPPGAAPADGAAAPPLPRRSLPRRTLRLWHVVDRLPGARWVKKMVAFPIGERFAVTSLTAALFDARVTFVVLLAWGGVAAAYTLAGRVLRSVAR